MAECINCEEEYNDKRLALGYQTCLNCGEYEAQGIIAARTHASRSSAAPQAAGPPVHGPVSACRASRALSTELLTHERCTFRLVGLHAALSAPA